MATHIRPRRITKLIVEEISLVDNAANGETWLLMKRNADGRMELAKSRRVIGIASIPEIAASMPSATRDPRERLRYNSSAVLAMLASVAGKKI